mgnify:FL=1
MKKYPSISQDPIFGKDYYTYDKLDGSNVRVEWTRKNGMSKFGSRKVLIGAGSLLHESVALMQAQEGAVEEVLRDLRVDKAVLFFEFYGENSFAGMHQDEDHLVSLIDVDIHKKGIMDPRDFEKAFRGKVPMPSLLATGNFNKEMADQVRNNTFEGVTFEGVVVKGFKAGKWDRPTMFKVKNQQWVDKVHKVHGSSAEDLV